MKYHFFFFTLLISISCSPISTSNESPESWRHVYTNSADGSVLYGSKKNLLEAVRNGYPIRIGFGGRSTRDTSRSIEHVANAQFLSIVDGQEVFAQITAILGQQPIRSSDTLGINFREGFHWSMIVGSNGYSDRVNINTFEDSIAGHNMRPTKVKWWAQMPSGNLSDDPLW